MSRNKLSGLQSYDPIYYPRPDLSIERPVSGKGNGMHIHLRIFLCICNSCQRNTEVGDWAPEVCRN